MAIAAIRRGPHFPRMKRLLAAIAFLAATQPAFAQRADPSLLTAIRAIRAIDNHAHPPALVAAGQKDDDFDALPCDPLEPTNPTISGRPENPRYIAAWKALYGYKYNDADSTHVRDILAAKQRMRTARGDAYPDWVLDQLGIETLLANRIAMGRGQRVPRFRWVPFADALLFPLDNRELAASTPDRKIFFAKEEALLKRYMKDLNVAKLPGSLDAYLSQVVTATLERQKRNGAVAVKFEAAYLRSLNFTRGDRKAADAAYARYASGAYRPRRNTPRCRTSCSITLPPSRDDWDCRSTFTPAMAAADTSSWPEQIRCCSSPCSTTRRCAEQSLSCCMEARARSRCRSHRCS